jgi:iron complex outermembrane receptor protein
MKPFIWAAVVAAAAPAWAQQRLDTVIVTGNPTGSRDIDTPASALSGTGLILRRGSTLGDTLDGLPGVSSSYFGPNANRPVIRGQDGDRIRVLSNAGASLDAASLSFDHAVPIDPLVVERIEVLRGPAALLYGGSAVGGVVNAIDNRIPKARIDGVSGAVETRLGGAANERAVSALVETGGPGFALHADAFGRKTDDLRVPAFERPLDDGGTERRRHVANSASSGQGGAIGGSLVWGHGYLGASIDTYRNDYGVVAEDDITIRMRRDKFALAGEWRSPGGLVTAWRGQASSTDYRHQEIERDGSIGTTFETRGSDARLEAVHRSLPLGAGRIEGTVGAQFESARFSALGEEAFVPSTRTRQAAAFVLERWTWGDRGRLSAGMRAEQVRVRSEGDVDPAQPQFGPAQERRFSPRSASVGAVLKLGPRWQFSSSAAYTERAPTSYELYANGVHAATGAYERGDPQQRLERGRNVDVALGWMNGANRAKASVFDSRFSNYIALAPTGEPDFVNDEGSRVPIFAFRGVRARLHGMEVEGNWRAMEGPRQVDIDARLDVVRGTDRDSGEPLPRLAAHRITLGVNLTEGAWTARAELQHVGAQARVPRTDTPTAGWTLINLATSHLIRFGGRDMLLFAKLHNVGDKLAFHASTVGTVRALAPLPGRSLAAGARFAF